MIHLRYDYIIVGAGSAGCVLTQQLSEDPAATVLLLEAGEANNHPDIAIPSNYMNLLKSPIDWGYDTQPEVLLHNRSIAIARGKVLGGCSALNAMIYIRGNPGDYDHWQALGNDGWSYQDVLPFFDKVEAKQPLTYLDPHPLTEAFIEAGIILGHPHNLNFNENSQRGIGLYQTTIKNGKRSSAATAFLLPIINRPNLSVETESQVSQIIIANNKAMGVKFIKNNHEQIAYANREVILCAGAINSPALLMLSGIGPAEHLATLKIPVIVDLPGVGNNLQDHLYVDVTYASNLAPHRHNSNGCEAGMFVAFEQAAINKVDLQIDAALDIYHDTKGIKSSLSLCPIVLHPQSRGNISLHSADFRIPPQITCHYLQAEVDLEILLKGIKISREIANIDVLKKLLTTELNPGAECSEAQLRDYIRQTALSICHPVGTCRMGKDALAVVNSKLQVYGIDNLRVVDASIMPTIPSGNTQAACLMIGSKGASLICEELKA